VISTNPKESYINIRRLNERILDLSRQFARLDLENGIIIVQDDNLWNRTNNCKCSHNLGLYIRRILRMDGHDWEIKFRAESNGWIPSPFKASALSAFLGILSNNRRVSYKIPPHVHSLSILKFQYSRTGDLAKGEFKRRSTPLESNSCKKPNNQQLNLRENALN